MYREHRLFVAALALVAWLVIAPPALAHAELIDASPAAGEVLLDPPQAVTLVFNEAVQPANDAIVVTSADGTRVAQGGVVVNPADTLTSTLAPLDPGTYTVSYRVISDDGHVVEGSYQFAVEAPPTTTTVPTITTAPEATEPGTTPTPVTGPSTVPATTAVPAAQTTTTLAAAPPTSKKDDNPFGLVLLAVAGIVGLGGGLTAWLMSRRGRSPSP